MAKSIKKNYVYQAAFQLLSILTPFITTPYISRVLQADGVGTVSFVNSVVYNFHLFASMGIYSYGRRETSYLQDDREKRSWVFWNLKSLAAINITISITVLLILTSIYAKENYHLYLISGMGMINIFLDTSWLYHGMEDFSKLVLKNIIVRFVYIAFLLTFVKSKADIHLYMISPILFGALGHIAMWLMLPRYISRPKIRNIRPYNDIKTIFLLFLPGIAVEVYTVLDKTMIGIFTGNPAENGYYEFGVRIARMTIGIITSLSGVIIPRIGYLFAKNDMEQIRTYIYRSYSFVWFLGLPICLGLSGISNNFVPWFLGPGYIKVAGLVKITNFLVMVISLAAITGGQYLVPTQRHNTFTKTLVIGAVINFCLNMILIPFFQSYGAAVASVIAEASIMFCQLYILRRELSIRKILSLGKNNFIAGLTMLAVLLVMDKKLAPSVRNTFTMIFTGAFVYISMLLILRDSFFIGYAQKTLGAVRKRLHI